MTSPSSPDSGQSPARQERAALLALLLLVSIGVLTGLLIALTARRLPAARRVPFDPSHLKSVQRQRPDVVIIGNSMVYTRLAESLIDDLVKPTRVKIISRGGTQSAIWYAQLKYYVVASGVKVKRVILFFRDRELTLGRARTKGPFSGNLQRAMPGVDPVIDEKLADVPQGALDHVRIALGKVVPIARLREFAATRADTLAMKLAGLAAGRRSAILEKKAINAVFEVESLRDVDAERMASWDDERPFAEGLRDAFLPEIIKLAKDNGIELSFVRVRRRRTAAGRPDSPEVAAYMNDLRRYLKQHQVGFIDQSNARWESLDLYGNGDHIAPRYRLQYTRLFVKHHPELFKLP